MGCTQKAQSTHPISGRASTVTGPECLGRAGPRWPLGCRNQTSSHKSQGCPCHGGIQKWLPAHFLHRSASLYLLLCCLVPSHSATLSLAAHLRHGCPWMLGYQLCLDLRGRGVMFHPLIHTETTQNTSDQQCLGQIC